MLFHLSPVPRSSAHPTVHLQKTGGPIQEDTISYIKLQAGPQRQRSTIHFPSTCRANGLQRSDDVFLVLQATLHLRDWPLLYNARNPNRNPNWWPQSEVLKKGGKWIMQFSMLKSRKWRWWRWWTWCGNDFQNIVTLIQKSLRFRKSKLLCLWDFDTSDSKSGSLRLGWFPLPWSTGSMARAQIRREIQNFERCESSIW